MVKLYKDLISEAYTFDESFNKLVQGLTRKVQYIEGKSPGENALTFGVETVNLLKAMGVDTGKIIGKDSALVSKSKLKKSEIYQWLSRNSGFDVEVVGGNENNLKGKYFKGSNAFAEVTILIQALTTKVYITFTSLKVSPLQKGGNAENSSSAKATYEVSENDSGPFMISVEKYDRKVSAAGRKVNELSYDKTEYELYDRANGAVNKFLSKNKGEYYSKPVGRGMNAQKTNMNATQDVVIINQRSLDQAQKHGVNVRRVNFNINLPEERPQRPQQGRGGARPNLDPDD